MDSSGPFTLLFVRHWQELQSKLSTKNEAVTINGRSLTLAGVILGARYGRRTIIADEALEYVGRNTEQVYGKIEEGQVIYGINTGFGGSANVRTKAIEEIQTGLIRGLHYGILSGETDFDVSNAAPAFASALPLSDPTESTSMPEAWVRGSMLIRLNSLCHGASGVRPVLLKRLLHLLNHDIIPRVPLRGSISASGDLSPLSYIGGLMQGKPSVQAWIGSRTRRGRRLVPGNKALAYGEIEPIKIRAKEGLAIVNGTAASAAVASLAIHEAMCLAATSKVITAMSVEALCGTDESFHAFFSQTRPHPGQTECASVIKGFLVDSRLVAENTGSKEFSIRQDRYAIRTAPQWIGPLLEDLVLAHAQVTVEINSATDNPLIDPSGNMFHGGNFQAKAVTSAMEKVRTACQSLGQMLFAQCTELINPATNKGLAPNLVVDEPSQSWMWKGTDIYIAALQSELGFLSNSVGTHVQFAEMGNQGINSLALISARYTLTAVDVLTQLQAAHLVALCQALDLRALQLQFLYALTSKFEALTRSLLNKCDDSIHAISPETMDSSERTAELWVKLCDILDRSTHMDSPVRFKHAMDWLQIDLQRETPSTQQNLEAVEQWNKECTNEACETYKMVRARYLAQPDAKPVLGKAAKRIYAFIRERLGVPFFGEEYIKQADWADGWDATDNPDPEFKFRTMGSMISGVYEALRNGSLYSIVAECFEEPRQSLAEPVHLEILADKKKE